MNTPEYIITHHTGGTDADPLADTSHHTFEIVNEWHRIAKDSNGNFLYHYGKPSSLGYYLAYHYFIDKKGILTQGRADTDQGAHTRGYNFKSIGICLAGNFDATMPTEAQVKTLTELLIRLKEKYSIPLEKIVPHRKFANKTCFGNKLPDNWGQHLIVDFLTPPLSPEPVPSPIVIPEVPKTSEEKVAKARALILEAAELLK